MRLSTGIGKIAIPNRVQSGSAPAMTATSAEDTHPFGIEQISAHQVIR